MREGGTWLCWWLASPWGRCVWLPVAGVSGKESGAVPSGDTREREGWGAPGAGLGVPAHGSTAADGRSSSRAPQSLPQFADGKCLSGEQTRERGGRGRGSWK